MERNRYSQKSNLPTSRNPVTRKASDNKDRLEARPSSGSSNDSMTAEEAIKQIELLGHSHFIFSNADWLPGWINDI